MEDPAKGIFKSFSIKNGENFTICEYNIEDVSSVEATATRMSSQSPPQNFVYFVVDESASFKETIESFITKSITQQSDTQRKSFQLPLRNKNHTAIGYLELDDIGQKKPGSNKIIDGEAELSFFIDPTYQGKGVMQHAIACLLSFAQEIEIIKVIMSKTTEDNEAAKATINKLGLKYEETNIREGHDTRPREIYRAPLKNIIKHIEKNWSDG